MHSKACQWPADSNSPSGKVLKPNIQTTKEQFDQVSQLKISYELVQEIKEEIKCQALAFNKEGTIMVAAHGHGIKIWEFLNGTLKSTGIILLGHTGPVQCLVFSKKQNWFASAGFNNSIRCWQEINKNKWVSTRSQTNFVLCLLLNQDGDQLLSSCWDHSIKVWKVNYDNNILTYAYSLHKHEEGVICISLNESETSLVSCGFDNKIIIWGKENMNVWKFKYYIAQSTDDYGHRISFINDNLIAWQQNTQATMHIFELDNEIFKERPNLSVALKYADPDSMWLFPSENGQFKVIAKPIYCRTSNTFGGLTNNGQYLVIWKDEGMALQVYRINYE